MQTAATYSLPAIIDTQASMQLQRQLAEKLAANEAVEIDGGAVERISTAGLQCLISAAASFSEARCGFSMKSPSPCLQSALADLQLGALFTEMAA